MGVWISLEEDETGGGEEGERKIGVGMEGGVFKQEKTDEGEEIIDDGDVFLGVV